LPQRQQWEHAVEWDDGRSIDGPVEPNVSRPMPGLGAGEGYLVVPAGNVLTGWRLVPESMLMKNINQ
jgi:hypothetical protein